MSTDPSARDRRTGERRAGERRSAREQRPRSTAVAGLGVRASRSQLLVALLTATLGFAVVVQVRSTRSGALPAAREQDLVRILDDLNARSDRLRAEIEALRRTRDRLTTGADRGSAALTEARRRAETLGILAGTVPAEGEGVVLTISDPQATVTAEVLLDALQELRDAGAETMMLNDVRLVASSHLVDQGSSVSVDGVTLRAPYRFAVIGPAHTLAQAMGIPGGVIDTVAQRAGASAAVVEERRVLVDALRPLSPPRYARPS